MKKIILTSLVIGSVFFTHANSLFDQLVAFNSNWSQYENRVPNAEAVVYKNDQPYIQKHLENVLQILASNPTAHLSCEQLESRTHLTELLRDYREAGLFPMNYYRAVRIPVFIDEHQTHCAVGYLLQQTGYDEVAQRIANANNYAWVREINDPALPVWQAASGFTMDELKLIQGAYDSYMPMAWLQPNKTEVPQKPEVIVRNFSGEAIDYVAGTDLLQLWCYGEGKNNVLHGKWIQNSAKNVPWIEGYYENGKRTGSWKEYYQGTDILCRTEHWRNDKLNGVRTRFDKEGNVIERITFKDGFAAEKVNYDLEGGLKFIRTPIDSMTVNTEIYSEAGYLLAAGKESIYNPSGLLWFQNIELTALNTMAITARDGAPEYVQSSMSQSLHSPYMLYAQPSLVQYHKFGSWKYYNEYTPETYLLTVSTAAEFINRDYPHLGELLNIELHNADFKSMHRVLDSIEIEYTSNAVKTFKGYGTTFKVELRTQRVQEYNFYGNTALTERVVSIGEVDKRGYQLGEWFHFNQYGQTVKKEDFFLPMKMEDELTLGGH